MSQPTIVIDGANVAYIEPSAAGEPKVSNIVAVVQELRSRGLDPLVIVDASLRHEVDDPEQLDALIDDQTIRQAPADTDADYFVLEIAEEKNASVVSNDRYEPYQDEYPWIEERRVPLMIVKGQVHLYDSSVVPDDQAG